MVFDRYYDFSTKSVARGGRETWVTRIHQLRIDTKLPTQNVVLNGVENKKELIVADQFTEDDANQLLFVFHTT